MCVGEQSDYMNYAYSSDIPYKLVKLANTPVRHFDHIWWQQGLCVSKLFWCLSSLLADCLCRGVAMIVANGRLNWSRRTQASLPHLIAATLGHHFGLQRQCKPDTSNSFQPHIKMKFP